MKLKQHPTVRMIDTLIRLIKQHAPKTFLVSSAIGVIGGLANTASIALVHQAVKGGVSPRLTHFAMFLALCLLAQLTRTLSQYLLWKGCLRSTVTLVTNLTESILATPLRRLEEIGPSKLVTALERDCVSLTDAVITMPLLLLNCTVLLGCAAYLAWQSPIAALVFIVLIVLATSSTFIVIGRTSGIQRRARAEVDRLFEYFRSQSAGVKELKLNAKRRADFLKGLRETAETATRLEVFVQTIYVASAGWFQLVFLIPIGVLVFVVTNIFSISVAEVGAYALVLLYMTSTIGALSAQFESLGRGAVAFSNIESLGLSLEKPQQADTEKSSATESPAWSHLELVNVTHSFAAVNGQRPFVVGPISLRFRRGEVVFITGGNGSGKTTLAKLLCGLYLPDEGAIRVDGVAVTPDSVEEYRQRFSAVFWDFHLFKRLFGLGAANTQEIARARLADLQLNTKVDVLDGEFTTLDLSQGQRKRLALLVGALENRDVYVFDEWAADQDQTFRDHFYNKVLPDLRSDGKTVFVISHDERYFGVADRVVKLDFGSVASDARAERYAVPA
jgi:putative pyoverdin transport system ATP-binding/permease protein